MIPPFFMLILEPFQQTSCYANACEDELVFYIYSRYVFILVIVIGQLIYVFMFRYIRKNLQNLLKKTTKDDLFYQDRLVSLLKRAIDNSKKPEHK
jgi:hypothetical protein